MKKPNYQMSESLTLGMLLALSGGFLDAYTFILRGEKFATMQTGNLILFTIRLFQGNGVSSCYYLIPIAAFLVGVFLIALLSRIKDKLQIHWRQYVILFIIATMLGASFIPVGQEFNWLANLLVSFSAGMQVEGFKKIKGYSIMTTMCTGNMKSIAEGCAESFFPERKTGWKRTLYYLAIVLSFSVGCVIGAACTEAFQNLGLLFVLIFYVLAFILMLIRPKKEETND